MTRASKTVQNATHNSLPIGTAPLVYSDPGGDVQIVALQDEFGFKSEFSPMRDLKVAQPYRVVGTSFGASIDTVFWTAVTSGAGSASGVAAAIATISSGTANSGYGKLSSTRSGRFLFAHPLMWRGAIRLTAVTVAENTRRWGAFSVSTVTPQNGFYFSVSATGVLSVNNASGGTPSSIDSGSFNGDVTSYTLDTNVHAYEIVYYTMGAWFYIDDVLIHKITPTTSVLAQSLSVPINIISFNSASGTTSGTIECWNSVIIRMGREETMPISYYQSGTTAGVVLKIGAGQLHSVNVSGVVNNSAITLYDNTAASGTVLWSSGTMGAQTTPFSIDLHQVHFSTGLTLLIAAANSIVTIAYE
jgi:hypothetical protein